QPPRLGRWKLAMRQRHRAEEADDDAADDIDDERAQRQLAADRQRQRRDAIAGEAPKGAAKRDGKDGGKVHARSFKAAGMKNPPGGGLRTHPYRDVCGRSHQPSRAVIGGTPSPSRPAVSRIATAGKGLDFLPPTGLNATTPSGRTE